MIGRLGDLLSDFCPLGYGRPLGQLRTESEPAFGSSVPCPENGTQRRGRIYFRL